MQLRQWEQKKETQIRQEYEEPEIKPLPLWPKKVGSQWILMASGHNGIPIN